MVTESKAIFSYLSGAVCPFPHPKGFSYSPRQAAGPASVPQARCGATYFGGAWADSPPTSKPARPALHHRVALALTAAVYRSRAAEFGDELKKPLQALRKAGRAKPRRIFAATFFRLQHVSPISRSNVSQLVTLCLNSPIRNHGFNYRCLEAAKKKPGTETGRCDDERGCACTSMLAAKRETKRPTLLRRGRRHSCRTPWLIRPPASPHPFAAISNI